MNETPSKRRRRGREAFGPGCNPIDFQPYKVGSWNYQMYLEDWLDGWGEAKKASEEKEMESEVICECCGSIIKEKEK